MERVCVYCGKDLSSENNYAIGDLCWQHWCDFRYGVILDEDPKFDIVEIEYHKNVKDAL